jgi:hypothetical protein
LCADTQLPLHVQGVHNSVDSKFDDSSVASSSLDSSIRYPKKSVGGGGMIIVGNIAAVLASTEGADCGLPEVVCKNFEIIPATREQPRIIVEEEDRRMITRRKKTKRQRNRERRNEIESH